MFVDCSAVVVAAAAVVERLHYIVPLVELLAFVSKRHLDQL